MERHTKIRKWIIYSGVFFLALSTVITIVSSSSKFNAQTALVEPCLAITDVNGDGVVNTEDCGSGGGGGVEPNPCLEEVITTEEATTPITDPKDCVCSQYEPFPPAHDAATESVHQATVTKTDTEAKSELDKIIKEVSKITGLDKNIAELKRLISLYTQTPSDELARRIVNTYKSILERKLSEPLTVAKIQLKVLDPIKLFEETLYEAIQLPTEKKKFKDDPWDKESPRPWKLFTEVRPDLSGIGVSWPADITISGINFNVKNTLRSSAGFSLCLTNTIGIGGRGNGIFDFAGVSIDYKRGNTVASLTFSKQQGISIIAAFPLPGGNK